MPSRLRLSHGGICCSSGIVEHAHKPEIHVQLLMAVEQGGPGVVGHKVELELLEAGQHHHVLDYARARLAADADQFEAVAMEMERMNVVAGIAKFQAVAASSVDGVGRF